MSFLKNIEEVAVEIQQQLVGGAGCSCGCNCSCTCNYGTPNRNSNFTTSKSAYSNGHFRAVRG